MFVLCLRLRVDIWRACVIAWGALPVLAAVAPALDQFAPSFVCERVTVFAFAPCFRLRDGIWRACVIALGALAR